MSGKTNNLFLDTLVPVIGGCMALGLAMYLAYAYVADMSRELHTGPAGAHEQEIQARIQPVGRVAVAGEEVDAEPETVAAVPEAAPEERVPTRELDGRAVYNAACTACHGMGIAGAPQTGDRGAWEARLERGLDQLVQHAIEGFQGEAGYMPPRGGHAHLTDEQVREAVQYMVDALEG